MFVCLFVCFGIIFLLLLQERRLCSIFVQLLRNGKTSCASFSKRGSSKTTISSLYMREGMCRNGICRISKSQFLLTQSAHLPKSVSYWWIRQCPRTGGIVYIPFTPSLTFCSAESHYANLKFALQSTSPSNLYSLSVASQVLVVLEVVK